MSGFSVTLNLPEALACHLMHRRTSLLLAATIASILQNVWFASFVGWAGGLHDAPQLLTDVDNTAALLLPE